jgi:hypothetical protein
MGTEAARDKAEGILLPILLPAPEKEKWVSFL